MYFSALLIIMIFLTRKIPLTIYFDFVGYTNNIIIIIEVIILYLIFLLNLYCNYKQWINLTDIDEN